MTGSGALPPRDRDRRLSAPVVICLLAVTLLAFGLRIYRLDGQSLWVEELISIALYLDKGLVEILRFNVTAGDPQPPLFYVLLHYWGIAAGSSTFALRFLSVMPGVLAVPGLFVLGERLAGGRVGLVAALLGAVNPFQVWYAQEIRTYTLTVALTLLSTLCCLQAFARPERRRRWLVGYAAVSTLSIYSHYFAYFVVFAQTVAVLLFIWRSSTARPRRAVLRDWLVAEASLFIPYLPWLPFAYRTIGAFTGWHTPVTPPELVRLPLVAFSLGTAIDQTLADRLFPGFLAVAGLGLLLLLVPPLGRTEPRAFPWPVSGLATLLLLAVPFVGVGLFIAVTGRTIFHERYFIVATPAYFLLLASGLAHGLPGRERGRTWLLVIPRRALQLVQVLGLAFVVATAVLGLRNHYFAPQFAKADLRSMVAFVKTQAAANDAIVTTDEGLQLVLDYYAKQKSPRLPVHVTTRDALRADTTVGAWLTPIITGAGRIWFVPYWNSESDHRVRVWLDRRSYRGQAWWFTGGQLYLYTLASDQQIVMADRSIDFSQAAAITGIAAPTRPVPTGREVGVGIRLVTRTDFVSGYRLTIDLVDQWGHRLRRDEWPLSGPNSSTAPSPDADGVRRFAVPVPGGTPPGEYRLVATLYPAQSDTPVNVVDRNGVPVGVNAEIARVQVLADPTAPEPQIGHPLDARFGSVSLVGAELPHGTFRPGQSLDVDLYWRALTALPDGLQVELTLIGPAGSVVGSWKGEPVNGTYPTGRWPAGGTVRDIWTLLLGPTVPTGEYELSATLLDRAGRSLGVAAGLGKLQVVARPVEEQMPTVQHPLDARMGDVAVLVGYDLTRPGPASAAVVTLYWKAAVPSRSSYHTFVHLLDAAGKIADQHDGGPGLGAAPTAGWRPGEVIADPHPLKVDPAGLGAGTFGLRIGMYDSATMQRLPVTVQTAGARADDSSVLVPEVPLTP